MKTFHQVWSRFVFVFVIACASSGCGAVSDEEMEGIEELEAALHETRLLRDWEVAVLERLPRETQQQAERDQAFRRQVIRQAVDEQRRRVSRLPDPFTPMFEGRDRSQPILWENREIMFLIPPSFDSHPSVLVVPRRRVSFPIDDLRSLDQLDQRAELMRNVFNTVVRARSRAFITPPRHLDVRQIYVNVVPEIRRVPPRDRPALFESLTRELTRRLGPAHPNTRP